MTTTHDTLAERYGAPSPWRRRTLLVAVVVVVLSFAGWLGWTIWEQSRPLVASGDLTFDIVDANHATARFVVDLRNPDVEATCTLRVYAEDHTLVGVLAFTPEPNSAGEVFQDISTDRQATSVELLGCTAPGQTRPR